MEVTPNRLLYDNIHDFKSTANHVESEIKRHGICHGRYDAVPGMNGRTHHDMWVSMKTVSHFNLGIALEEMLKLLLILNKTSIPKSHYLTKLHVMIPVDYQKRLEDKYQASRSVLPNGHNLIAFINTSSTPPPKPRQIKISRVSGGSSNILMKTS